MKVFGNEIIEYSISGGIRVLIINQSGLSEQSSMMISCMQPILSFPVNLICVCEVMFFRLVLIFVRRSFEPS